MIEKTVKDYLKTHLSEGRKVYMEVPENPPDEYVIVEKTGSGQSNHINQAMIAVRSVSKNSMYKAAELNEEVVGLMDNIIYSEDIFRCELNSDYNFTNTATKEYRYQAVFNLFY